MRPLVVAVLLLTALVPFVPGAAAASLAEDPAGDAQLTAFGLPAAPGGAQGDAADLLALDLVEDAEKLTFTLKIANLQQQASFADYMVRFTWGDYDYRVQVQRQVTQNVIPDSSWAYLWVAYEDEDGDFDSDIWADLDHTVDVESGLITVVLPKAYLIGEEGDYPRLGDKLADMYVEARNTMTLLQFTADAYDRMPDGEDTLDYSLVYGDIQSGHIRMDAVERVRVSNGGATTFVYKTTIFNTGDNDEMVDIVVSELPEGWNATVTSPLRVPADGDRTIAVLVSVPFAHDHGGFSSFNLTATSQESPGSSASIRMGVLHTPIPQPAGHHSELYLHSQNFNSGILGGVFSFNGGSMNTDAAHELDGAEATAFSDGEDWVWYIPLTPALRMGLDFDTDGLGELSASVIGHSPTTPGNMFAELFLTSMDEDGDTDATLLAESDLAPVTLDMSAPAAFKLTLTPTAESDYVPYARGQNMVLMLRFTPDSEVPMGPMFCCAAGTTPGLQTQDFVMKLPLNEYHDRLTGLGETDSVLSIKADGLVEKAGLPGTTMTYSFTLTNHGASDEIIDLDLAGTDALLGELVPAESVTLAAKEKRTLTLAVTIPADANDGEELEVLIFAHARDDPSKTAIARTKTLVARTGSVDATADETAVLQAARAADQKDTPAPGAALLLAGLGVAALVARRRK